MEKEQAKNPDEVQEQNAKSKKSPLLKYHQVIAEEDRHLKKRRLKMRSEREAEDLVETRFGIALSGGGIRSATINLGLLKTLNQFRILEKADYLSTVSGGGYTGAHIQAMLKQTGDYQQLFQTKQVDRIRQRGEYMTPGQALTKYWNMLILVVGYVISTIMSWVSPFLVIFLGVSLFAAIGEYYDVNDDVVNPVLGLIDRFNLLKIGWLTLLVIFITHLFCNIIFNFGLGVSRFFNKVESALALVVIFIYVLHLVFEVIFLDINLSFFEGQPMLTKMLLYLLVLVVTLALGYIMDLNALSFHRFYRNQLAEAFLNEKDTGTYHNVLVKDLFNAFSENKRDYIAPYPLINTCLNLQAMGGNDENFKGAKASDYFLLSPLFFGSKLTKYLPSNFFKDYRNMTLPAAMAISAAAVNPGMGTYSNKILSVLMTVFNARFGFWISNPLKYKSSQRIWWPTYFFKELFSQIGTANRKLNISDGGHIENLGVYELLRRRCRLIISIDAGADPNYTFTELEILAVRARNELGLEIEFRDGHVPEDVIRPKPSHGYSQQRFAIADVYHIWDEIDSGKHIKDRDYKSFEVIINYNDLKESIKGLDFHGKLLVRIIFRVITEFKASTLLDERLGMLEIRDVRMVKEMLRSEIFSETVAARHESIYKMLKQAVRKQPDAMKPLLKAVGLLNPAFDSRVKLSPEFIENLVETKLEDKVIDLEKALLDKLDAKMLGNAYKVMKTFLGLLNGVRSDIEYKLCNEFLLRKLEDEVIKQVLKEKGVFDLEIEETFAKEPDDPKLIEWMKSKGLPSKMVNDLMGERNQIRTLLSEPISPSEMKMKLVNLRLDVMPEDGVLALEKFHDLLNDSFTRPDFDEKMVAFLEAHGYQTNVIERFKQLRKTQQDKLEEMMEKVSNRIEKQVNQDIKMGTLIYIKSSVRAPLGKIYIDDSLKYAVYKYKIYHPDFPHESTADQFFDEVQWESYYLLGQYLAAEILGVSGLDSYFDNELVAPDFSIRDLLYRFDHEGDLGDMFTYVSKPTVDPDGVIREVESMVKAAVPKRGEMPAADVEAIPSEEELMKTQKIQKKVVAGKQIDYTI